MDALTGTDALSVINAARNCGGNGGYGYGDMGWFWIIIILLAFGRNGYGFGGGNGIADNYVLSTDFANIERKLDGINNGICDSTFALNNNLTTGFAGVQQTLCQGFNGVNTAILQSANATERGFCNLTGDLANCCCKIERGIDSVNYNSLLNTNNIQQTLCNNTRDIIENQNANYRALHEELVANKLEAKNERIAEQQNEINALRLAASQQAQNAYLLNELKPCPSPSYLVANPNCCGLNYNIIPNNYNNCGCSNAAVI